MNRLSIRIIVCVVSLLLSVSCNRQYIANTLVEFTKSEIIFPKDLEVCSDGVFKMANLNELKTMKLIVYYDSTECSDCRITHIMELEPLYRLSEVDGRFEVLTIFSPKTEDVEKVRLELMLRGVPFPVYVDTFGAFSRINSCIPQDVMFHCFMTDIDGTPVFVGNPVLNEKLYDVFMEIVDKYSILSREI